MHNACRHVCTCVHRERHTDKYNSHTHTHICAWCYVTSVVFNSLWPYGLWPARLLCPWDSTGKHTGVGCHALLQKTHIYLDTKLHTSLIKIFIPRWEKSMWLGTKWPNSVKNEIKMGYNPITQMTLPLVYNIHYAALPVVSFTRSFNIPDYMWHSC